MKLPSQQPQGTPRVQDSVAKDGTFFDLDNPSQLPHVDLSGNPPVDFRFYSLQWHPRFHMSLGLQPKQPTISKPSYLLKIKVLDKF